MEAAERAGVRWVAAWLAVVAWISISRPSMERPAEVPSGLQRFSPNLQTAGWRELACLPGVGSAQARAIVAGRAALGVPLTVDNLGLIPGVGPATTEAVRHALSREGPG